MIANKCPSGRPQDPNHGRRSVTIVAIRELRIRKPEKFGFWIGLLFKMDELNMWLLSRAMHRWQLRQFKRELERQRAEWN